MKSDTTEPKSLAQWNGQMQQTTLRNSCQINGIGLHTGTPAQMKLLPAAADTGIVFRVGNTTIPAAAEYAVQTCMNTGLGRHGVTIGTVEHLLSALRGMEIDNVLIELSGEEVPAVDGSAEPFVQALLQAGRRTLPVPRRMIRLLDTVRVEEGDKFAEFGPSPVTSYNFHIAFNHQAVGQQDHTVVLTPHTYQSEVAAARTFGFESDLDALRKSGLAQGAGLHNAVGLGADGSVLNAEGLRFSDEFVRHKILDAVGDLALFGAPILGAYTGHKAGHALNLKLTQALATNPQSWEWVTGQEFQVVQAG